MSRCWYILLLSVALLIAAASLGSGGRRLGEITPSGHLLVKQSKSAILYESRADVLAVSEDLAVVRARTKSVPPALVDAWRHTWADVKTLPVEIAGAVPRNNTSR
jgi:hypothetical protein